MFRSVSLILIRGRMTNVNEGHILGLIRVFWAMHELHDGSIIELQSGTTLASTFTCLEQ